MTSTSRIPMIKDVTQALMVLALVFLNFSHAPSATAYDGNLDVYLLPAIQQTIFCNDAEPESDHAPCHACRTDGTPELPMLCSAAIANDPGFLAVRYTPATLDNRLQASVRLPPPTGPPAA